ncbi:hypothetical protein [Maricaulis maris]|uniref:hypothetical protein n=1 Tax=Maricaulis maris TaxID=74318 RepID=UPI002925FEE0|nr:hypothetical protein MACH15_24100 [Maricaulis maris]
MTFTVTHVPANHAACLIHIGVVSGDEIRASRLELKAVANANSVRGAIIDITDASIEAPPVEIIDNVQGLVDDLLPGTKLGFVGRAEDQETVSMIVATVAHSLGRKVGQFHDRETALCWIRLDWTSAAACNCLPITE